MCCVSGKFIFFSFLQVLCQDLEPWHTKLFIRQHKLGWGSLFVLVGSLRISLLDLD